MLNYASKKHIKNSIRVYFATSIFVFIIIFYSGWHAISQYEENLLDTKRSFLKNELTVRSEALIQAVNYRFSLLYGVQAFVSTNLDLYHSNPQEFERKATLFLKTIHSNVPDVKSISISPGGVNRYIFPDTEINLKMIGHDLFADLQPNVAKKINQIIKRKGIGVSEPYYLNHYQELGAIARLAIFQDDLFWGLANMTLDLVPILTEANLQNSKNGLFLFSIRMKGGDVFYGDTSVFDDNPVSYQINLPDCQWEVAITTAEGLNELNIISLYIINFLLASLIGSLLYNYLTRKKYVDAAISEKVSLIKQDQEALEAVFQALPDLYFRTAKDGTILDYHVSKPDHFYVTSEKFIHLKIQEVLPNHTGSIVVEKIAQYLLTKELQTFEYTLEMPTGKYDYEVRLTGFPDSDDLIIIIREVTERKKSEELIWYQANYDPLTKLPNRRMLNDRLDQEIIKSRRIKQSLALLFIDLDRFKDVNDSLGHDMGDVLLVESAKRITNCIRDSDTVARFGGDEFTVILSELDDVYSIERIAQNIIKSLSNQFLLENNLASISASIGISIYPNDAKDVYGLLKNADQAMYRAKALGRSRFSYFTKSMQQAAQYRLIILNDMHKALAEKQFELYFQPIVDLTTDTIHKAEALLRWNHPKVGLVNPDTFISLAEETGFIVEIGNWVFEETVQQIKNLKDKHGIDMQVSVNKSPVQFQTKIHHEKWIDYLQQLELPGESIIIEITESLLMENDQNINNQLLKFRDLGIQVSLDDFGTGYSSLSYLKKFDIDFVKLDQSFIKNLAPHSEDMALSEAIIVMAHTLELKVIAEGIETEQQRKLLIDAGCDYGQGYLFAKPLPAGKFITFLKESSGLLS